LKKAALRLYAGAVRLVKDQTGSLPQLTWVLGATVLTVLIVVVLMRTMPDTVGNFFSAAAQWIRSQFGF